MHQQRKLVVQAESGINKRRSRIRPGKNLHSSDWHFAYDMFGFFHQPLNGGISQFRDVRFAANSSPSARRLLCGTYLLRGSPIAAGFAEAYASCCSKISVGVCHVPFATNSAISACACVSEKLCSSSRSQSSCRTGDETCFSFPAAARNCSRISFGSFAEQARNTQVRCSMLFCPAAEASAAVTRSGTCPTKEICSPLHAAAI